MRFLISEARDGDARYMYVSGEVDLQTGSDLRRSIESALDEAPTGCLIIDLSAVTFLDCAGIGALVYGRNLANNHQRGYAIRNARGMPLTLLTMTGVLP